MAERRLSETAERNRDEAGWFMKVAWNLALQCGDNYHEMGELFSTCYKVCFTSNSELSSLSYVRSCHIIW